MAGGGVKDEIPPGWFNRVNSCGPMVPRQPGTVGAMRNGAQFEFGSVNYLVS